MTVRHSASLAGTTTIVLLAVSLSPGTTAAPQQVHVNAGPYARRHTVVSFPMTGAAAGATYALKASSGSIIPLQVQGGTASFILPELAAGASAKYTVEAGGRQDKADITAERKNADVHVTSGGRPVLEYVGGAGRLPSSDIKPIFQRGGYLHPVHTPSGRVVTADYPPDHRHHHGIWFAWTRAGFQGREVDFWNMGDGKGRVEFDSLETTWRGVVQAGFRAKHRYVDLTSGKPIDVLSEQWDVRTYAASADERYFLFDIDVVQTNVADTVLKLPEYHYGGMAVRGAPEFVTLENVQYLTSEGKDRSNADATTSRWAAIAGTIDGQKAGIAILGHPSNFRAPEPMRVHPTDPYMCYAPSRSGPWEIASKGTHAVRYRFVAFDGAPDAAELNRLWQDYAHPPQVTVR